VYSGVQVTSGEWYVDKISLGDTLCGYSFHKSEGAYGGVISVWNASRVNVWSSMGFDNVLVIEGTVIQTAEEFIIINVYAPCETAAKKELWDQLNLLVLNNLDTCLCVCVDFNSVCSAEERKGRGSMFRQFDADLFNKFIHDSILID